MIPWDTFKTPLDAYEHTQGMLRKYYWSLDRPIETPWGGPDVVPTHALSAPHLPDRFETFWADPDGREPVILPVRR